MRLVLCLRLHLVQQHVVLTIVDSATMGEEELGERDLRMKRVILKKINKSATLKYFNIIRGTKPSVGIYCFQP